MLGAAAPAQADILVANIKKATATNWSIGAAGMAQAFTAPAGYRVDKIYVKLSNISANHVPTVTLRAANGANEPGETLATLSEPATVSSGELAFTVPSGGVVLQPGTYFVHLTYVGGLSTAPAVAVTSDDAYVGQAGWSIANSQLLRKPSSWESDYRSLQIAVDGAGVTVPRLTGAAITSSPRSGVTYIRGETIAVRLTFSENVVVTGTPLASIGMGSGNGDRRGAKYASGSGTNVLVFNYVVTADDADTDGVSIFDNPLAQDGRPSAGVQGGGSIKSASTQRPALLTGTGASSNGSHKVNGAKVPPPTITNIEITSSPGADGEYVTGDVIDIRVTFSERLDVSFGANSAQRPQLKLSVGGNTRTVNFSYSLENVRTAHAGQFLFTYTVVAGDVDLDGVSVPANGFGRLTTIIERAGTTVAADLTHGAYTSFGDHKVNRVPRVAGIRITSPPGPDGEYTRGEVITATVTFSQTVNQDGWHAIVNPIVRRYAPFLELDFGDGEGGGTREARTTLQSTHFNNEYVMTLDYAYKVKSTDRAPDGVGIVADSLTYPSINRLVSGASRSLPVAERVVVNLAHPAYGPFADHKVYGPEVAGITLSDPGPDGFYKAGETITVTVTLKRAFASLTGGSSMSLKLNVGENPRTASFSTSSGSAATLTFTYTVADGELDADGVSVPRNGFNKGTAEFTYSDGSSSLLGDSTHRLYEFPGHKVDGIAPKVIAGGVKLTSEPGEDYRYVTGNSIKVTVTFDEAMKVEGAPSVKLMVGTTQREARYESGTGTPALVFAYAVGANDRDDDGVGVVAGSLAGTVTDLAGNPVAGGHGGVEGGSRHRVNPPRRPFVKSVSITSDPGADGHYVEDDVIEVTVEFSEPVLAIVHGSQNHNRPLLALEIGGRRLHAVLWGNTRAAKTLVFEAYVQPGDTGPVRIGANSIRLNGSLIQGAGGALKGLPALLDHAAVPDTGDHKVGLRPVVTNVKITSDPGADETYTSPDVIEVTVTFDQAVTVVGGVALNLTVGNKELPIPLIRGSGGTALVFDVSFSATEFDADGVSIAANSLRLLGPATLRNAAGVDAVLDHPAVPADPRHRVNAAPHAPKVQSVAITSDPGADETYTSPDVIEVTVTFDQAVTVVGGVALNLTVGNKELPIPLIRGSGGTALVFDVSFSATEFDADGVSIAANSLRLLGPATLRNAAGVDAVLDHPAVPADPRHRVNAAPHAPKVQSVAITSDPGADETYTSPDVIEVTVTFDQAVTVVGGVALNLTVGNKELPIPLIRGSGGTALVFDVSFSATEFDADGVSIAANSLRLLGPATLRNAAGVDAVLDHPAVPADPRHRVNAAPRAPKVQSVAITSDPGADETYTSPDVIEVTVTFDQAVTVVGGVALNLTVGNKELPIPLIRGSGGTALVFDVSFSATEFDADGVSIAANSLRLLGPATLRNAAGVDAVLDHPAVSADPRHRVNAAPRVTGVAITSDPGADETYMTGDRIEVTVTFDQAVTLDGYAFVLVNIGGTDWPLDYESGSGTDALVFARSVPRDGTLPTDSDDNGISIGRDRLFLGTGATLQGAGGATAELGHRALPDDPRLRVNVSDVISIEADGSEVEEGSPVRFTLARNGAAAAALTVTVTAVDPGSALAGTPPETVTFGAGASTAPWSADTSADPGPGPARRVTLTVAEGEGYYVSGTHGTASVTVRDAVPAAPPRVAGVEVSSGADRTYAAGDVVEVTVTFDRPVKVDTGGGTPSVVLRIGGRERVAAYAAGSGAQALAFRYTVGDGEEAGGMQVEALRLDGATIRDGWGNDAERSFHVRHFAGVGFDGTAPAIVILQVVSTPGGWAYRAGEAIELRALFDGPVTVDTAGGTPSVALDVGGAARDAVYVREGSGEDTLLLRYEVVDGEQDANGFSVAANALAANGAAIEDAAGNPADLGHRALLDSGSNARQRFHRVDARAPELLRAAVDKAVVTLTYDEALDRRSAPAPGAFAVTAGGARRTVTRVAVRGAAAVLTLDAAVAIGARVTVAYTPPTSGARLRDLNGHEAAALDATEAVNGTGDEQAPALDADAPNGPVTVDGAVVTLTYDEALDANSTPAGADFAVRVAGRARTVDDDGVKVAGRTVTLALGEAATVGATVRVSYTPGAAPIRDAAGNAAAGFAERVARNLGSAASAVTVAAAFSPAEVDEGEDAVFRLTRTGRLEAALSVAVAVTQEGGVLATAGGYRETVTFPADEASVTLAVRTEDDTEDEPDGAVIVTLEAGAEYVLGAAKTATVAVLDDDEPEVTVSLEAPAEVAENVDGGAVIVTVTARTQAARAPSEALELTLSTAAGTAAAGEDFRAIEASVTLAPAAFARSADGSHYAASAERPIEIVDDAAAEPAETFTVRLAWRDEDAPAHVTLGAPVTIAILDDDANLPPAFTSPAAFEVAENETEVGTVAAEDADAGDEVTGYAIAGGADGAKFAVDGRTGELRFREAPDFEARADADGDNVYELTVEATSGAGPRALTAEQPVTVTVTDVAPPPAPEGLSVSGATQSTLSVGWEAPPGGVTGYEVRYRKAGSGDDWRDWPHAGTETRATIEELDAGTAYEIQVRALGGEGLGAWSAVLPDPATDVAAPAAPEELSVSGATQSTLSVGWEAPPGAAGVTGYEVRYRKAGSGDEWRDWPHAGTETRATIEELDAGTAYEIQVRALGGEKLGAWSAVREGTTAAGAVLTARVLADGDSDFASASHTGPGDAPQVVVRFSEAVARIALATPSVRVEGATRLSVALLDAARHEWIFRLKPEGGGDIGFELVSGRPCAEGGICTAGKVPLSGVPDSPHVVRGPGEVSGQALTARVLTSDDNIYASDSHTGPGDSPQVVIEFNRAVAGIDAASNSLDVSGADVVSAWPLAVTEDEPNDWVVYLAPHGPGAIGFTLVANQACGGNAKGICTAAGTMLSDVPSTAHEIPGRETAVSAPAVVSAVSVTSAPGGGGYAEGEAIEATVRFSEPVTVDVSGGTPTIGIVAGGAARRAPYARGSGTASLVFAYTVTAEDGAVGGARVAENALALNGGTIKSGVGVDADLAYDLAPAVTGVSIAAPGDDGRWDAGDAAEVAVRFSEAVTVETEDGTPSGGTPSIGIEVGGQARRALYARGSGTAVLVFAYTVTAEDGAVDGVRVAENGLALGGGTIRDGSGNNAVLAHGAAARAALPASEEATQADGPALRVEDARVREGADAAIGFTVTLAPASPAPVTVDWATADGTAKAGEDYLADAGTLTFAPGETEKTVAVAVLDDAHDEGEETFLFTLSNASGAVLADAEAVGTIVNSDHMPKAWLARFGRTVTGHVLDAVEARLEAPRAAGGRATLAGQALPSWNDDGGASGSAMAATDAGAPHGAPGIDAADRAAAQAVRTWLAGAGAHGRDGGAYGEDGRAGFESRALTGREFVTGTSFALTGGSAEGGGFAALWGRGALTSFDGREGDLTLDGEVTTGLLGADWAADPGSGSGAGRWTAGLALGHSRGTGGYRGPAGSGDIEATLTGVYPYAGLTLTDRLSGWAAAGYGAGEVRVTPEGRAAMSADLTMSMGAAGLRGEVLRPGNGEGLALAVKGDARFTRTSSSKAKTGSMEAADADVWLLRTGIEGVRRFALGEGGDGAAVTPSFELGLRLDGGDAETGLGADLGGGLAFADPKHGLSFDLKARGLVAHEAPGFREWGASVSFAYRPRPETDRGLSLSLGQSWGASPSGGMDALLGRETLAGLAANDDGGRFEASSRLEGELGYGFAAFGGAFTGTPNIGFGLSDNAREVRLGWRLTSAVPGDPGFEVSLDATRREAANENAEHGAMLRGTIRW